MKNDEPCDESCASRPRFDGTVNLGHVLTAAAMILGGFTVWSQSVRLQERTNVQISMLHERMDKQEAAIRAHAEIQQRLEISNARLATLLETFGKQKP